MENTVFMYTGRAAASPLTEDTPPQRNSLVANSYLLWYNQVPLKLQGWAPWVWALTVPSHCGIPNKAGRRKYRQNGGLWEPESPVIPREQAVTPGQTRDGQRCWDSPLGPPARYAESRQQRGDPAERTGRQSRGSGVCVRVCAAGRQLFAFWVFFFFSCLMPPPAILCLIAACYLLGTYISFCGSGSRSQGLFQLNSCSQGNVAKVCNGCPRR